jgi:hypothetical protein
MLGHLMTTRKDALLDTATDRAKALADYGTATWEEIAERIAPLLEAAAKKIGPFADNAWEAAKSTTRRAAGFTADRVERMQPVVHTALGKMSPVVDRAQKTVQNDVLPKMINVLHQAAATPAGHEAREILARLDERTGISMPTRRSEIKASKKASKAKTIATLATIGAILGALAVAIRTLLGSRAEWEAYEADEPYVYPGDDYEFDEVLVDTDLTQTTGFAGEAPATTASESPYGEGSYVGDNPPAGFEIKGNERSMKYHVPGAAGYARTTAEVWFSTPEAAEAAGFARSQR